ncbi:unnamed protein product [Symbiodinium sp. CCMP2592]|nr:unnamed protein product [Symbiodinium sp. CCMP2592]
MLLKDILDDFVRTKPEGKKHTRAGEARRKEAIGQQQGHEFFEPFQFISDAAVEAAFDVIAGLLASFGCTQPNMAKYKAAFEWVLEEHDIMGKDVLKKETQMWVDYHAGTLRARVIYLIRLYRKTPDRSPKIQTLKDILAALEAPAATAVDASAVDGGQAAPVEDSAEDGEAMVDDPTEEGGQEGSVEDSAKDGEAMVEDPTEEGGQEASVEDSQAMVEDPTEEGGQQEIEVVDPKAYPADRKPLVTEAPTWDSSQAEKLLEDAAAGCTDALPELQSRLLTRTSQAVADVAVAVAVEGTRSGAAMKRPAAAALKRKAEEPLEEVDPDEVKEVDGDNDGPGQEADEGQKPKKRSTRTPEEREVLKSLPELENYRVLFITGKHTGLPITWKEIVQPCIKAALSLEAGKDLSVVEDAFEKEKECLMKLTAQRRAELAVKCHVMWRFFSSIRLAAVCTAYQLYPGTRAVAFKRAACARAAFDQIGVASLPGTTWPTDRLRDTRNTEILGSPLACRAEEAVAGTVTRGLGTVTKGLGTVTEGLDMKRGNGANCTASGADVSQTPIKSPDMKKIRTAADSATTRRVSTKSTPPVPKAVAKKPDSGCGYRCYPCSRFYASTGSQEFGTPGAAMSVDPTPERVQDDWWCDGSWHRGWDHGWYGYTPMSWNGWWAGRGWDDDDSWSATSWQSSSTDTCRWERKDPSMHRMTNHLQSDKSLSRDSLEVLLEKAYEGFSDESDPDVGPPSEGKESRGSLKSLDSATTLELGSMSRESLEDEVADTLVDKGIELDDGSADKLPKITVQEDGRALPSTVQEGEKQVPQNTVQVEAEKQVPQSTVQEAEKQVPQSTVQEAEKQVPQSTVQEAEKQVQPQSTVQEAEKQVQPQSTVQEAEKQLQPQNTVQVPEKQVQPQSTVQDPEKQVQPQSTVQVPEKQVQPQSGADTAAGGGQMVKQEPESDDWRRDKYGKLLGPAALYARFYRTGRSLVLRNASFGIKGPKSPPEVREKMADAERSEDLANDLYARHKELEMTLLKVFDTIKDISDKKFTNSADMQIEANDVDENDVHTAMDALLDEEMPESSLQPGKPGNNDNQKPKPQPKPKKEKTWREKAQDADKRANKEIIDYAGFKQASNMKAAILADVDPAKIHLEQVKYKVATAIGQKVSEVKMEPLFRELEAALQKFKTVSEPVRAAERKVAASEKPPKATAKAKAKGKVAAK